jgi:hypothetical protein
MRVIGIELLATYCAKEPNCKKWINEWLADLRGKGSLSVETILFRYPRAVLEQNQFLIFTFSIDEVQYFMKVQVAQGAGVIVVKWLGNTVEYKGHLAEAGHGN